MKHCFTKNVYIARTIAEANPEKNFKYQPGSDDVAKGYMEGWDVHQYHMYVEFATERSKKASPPIMDRNTY